MLSRVANSIYWMSRYVERVENYARLLSANINLSYDLSSQTDDQWSNLLDATHDLDKFKEKNIKLTGSNAVNFLAFEKENPYSIVNSLMYARENARTIKETLPKEVWEHLNTFYHEFNEFNSAQHTDFGALQQFFDNAKLNCHLFFGIVDGCLTRNEAYYFLNLGKFIERADKTSRFLDVGRMHDSLDASLSTEELLNWSAVLKSVSAFNMYRQQYKKLDKDAIVNFLVRDTAFPRSINFSMYKVHYSLGKIGIVNELNSAEQKADSLKKLINSASEESLKNENLTKFLSEFQTENNVLDTLILKEYF
jgi:uncharacterized alpha-E superfamily protein